MIELIGVTKQYLYGARVFGAVDNSFGDGEIVAVLGGDGSGKTTFLKVLAGVESCEGAVLYDGKPVQTKTDDVIMMFDDLALFKYRSVFYNLYYPLKIRNIKKSEAAGIIAEAAEAAGLTPCLFNRVFKLELADKKRIGLARLYLRPSKVFIIDDPTKNLTSDCAEEIFGEIARLMLDKKRENGTVVFSTSKAEEAISVADRIIVLHAGEVKQIGAFEEIYHTPSNAWAAEAVDKYYNLLKAHLTRENGKLKLTFYNNLIKTDCDASCFEGKIIDSYVGKEVLVGCHSEDFKQDVNCGVTEKVKYAFGDGAGYINFTENGFKIRTDSRVETVCIMPNIQKVMLYDAANENGILKNNR